MATVTVLKISRILGEIGKPESSEAKNCVGWQFRHSAVCDFFKNVNRRKGDNIHLKTTCSFLRSFLALADMSKL